MSNTQTKNVPELRFPGFEGEWEEKKLEDLGLFQKSYSFSRAKEGNGKTKHIHYGDIHSKFKTVLDSDGNIPNIIEKAVFELIQKGDIVFADASEDYSDLGKAVMIDFEPNSLISGLHTHLFRPLNNAISNFLIFYTKTLSYKKFIRQQGTGISVLGISKKSLLNLNVLIPRSELEQQKIGQFFSKLDRQIELEEQKLELLQQQKKGYMQKIFSQELRFKDENGNDYPEWENKRIEDIANVNKGFTPSTNNNEYWDNNDKNWLSIAGMNQKYLYKGNKGISKDAAKNYMKVKNDTLIMSFKLTIGKLAIVKAPLYTNEAICHFIWKVNKINTEFIYYYLNSLNISTFGVQAVKGVTLNNDSINSIIVKLPNEEEQNIIAKFLLEVDKTVNNQLVKTKLLKQ
ncbi:TPA: restriction endonuclease subunit S, partial [Staphylococcus aureus]|nr:restriction endonuclease subunit S [Staphylococcus aureus]HCZ2634585.1 restriction endonuclease subunit S [Staphylococcus aureus]